MTSEISQNFVFGLLQSQEQFPVDFDIAWVWLGYAKKQTAKEKLVKNFIEGEDFLPKGIKSSTGGRCSEAFMLTINCFKQLAMMAGTEKGASVRRYFLDCEEKLKQIGGPVMVTPQQARDLANPHLAKLTIKEKCLQFREVRDFLDRHPDCVDIVKQIFKD